MFKTRIFRRLLPTAIFLATVCTVARAQTPPWWNPDYTRRVPVTILNTDSAATPAPASAEITLSPIPAEVRADWTDLRVARWNGTAWTDLDRQVLLDAAPNPAATPPVEGALRVVFRLAAPIAPEGSDTSYFLYYGSVSPNRPSQDIYEIYDHVVDFQAFDIDQEPTNFAPAMTAEGQAAYKISVVEYNGKKEAYFDSQTDHPRAWVPIGQMPAFKNVETYARVTPSNQDTGEIWTCARVVADPTDGNYGGSYSFGMDAYGSRNGVVHWKPDGGMDLLDSVDGYYAQADITENMVLRATDTLCGKTWKDGSPQRPWDVKDVAYADKAPAYDLPGTVGVASYWQRFYLEFIAAREILPLAVTIGAADVAPVSTSRIAGTVTSTKLGPMPDLPVVISDGTTTWTVYTNAAGKYQLSLPAGSYSVSASVPYHTPVNLTNVSPSAAAITDLTLTYIGVKVTGSVRDLLYARRQAGMHVSVSDASGHFLLSTDTDSEGKYSLMLNTGGTYTIGAWNDIDGQGFSARATISPADGADVTQDFSAGIAVNGDAEIPNDDNSFPAGWAKDGWNAHYPNNQTDTTRYGYSQAQNHTPGGHWSVVVTNPDPANNSGISDVWAGQAFFPYPVIPADYTLGAWVYGDTPGLRVRLRTRSPNWDGGNGATLTFGTDLPVNQWVQITSTDTLAQPGPDPKNPTGPIPNVEFSIYVMNVASGAAVQGNVYIDDVTVAITPKFFVIGKVTDRAGAPLTDAWAGILSKGGTAGAPATMLDNVAQVNEKAEFRVYTGTADPTPVAAVGRLGLSDASKLPGYDNLVDFKSATPVPYDPNLTTPTVTLVGNRKAGVVSGNDKGTSADSYTWGTDQQKYARVGNGTPVTNAFDDNFWNYYATGGNQGNDATKDIRVNFLDIDLGLPYAIDQINLFYEPWPTDTMKVWITNTPLDSSAYPPVFPPDADLVYASTKSNQTRGITGYGEPWGFTSTSNLYQIIRLQQPKTGQYIRIWTDDTPWPDGHFGFREVRVISSAATPPPPFSAEEVVQVLKIAGGVDIVAGTSDLEMYDTNGDQQIDLSDAAAMMKAIRNW